MSTSIWSETSYVIKINEPPTLSFLFFKYGFGCTHWSLVWLVTLHRIWADTFYECHTLIMSNHSLDFTTQQQGAFKCRVLSNTISHYRYMLFCFFYCSPTAFNVNRQWQTKTGVCLILMLLARFWMPYDCRLNLSNFGLISRSMVRSLVHLLLAQLMLHQSEKISYARYNKIISFSSTSVNQLSFAGCSSPFPLNANNTTTFC